MKRKFDTVIIGSGAAGMMCAAVAAKRGRSVLVVDHSKRIGEKIRISGGGRCNFTNIYTGSKNFISQNPHFVKSALGRYRPDDFISLAEQYGIDWHEKTKGQLFCDGSAQQIVDMLLAEMHDAGVELSGDTQVRLIEKSASGFAIETSSGDFMCENLVIACGGKSIPKIGASGFGYEIARQFGVNVLETAPALVPLTFANDDLLRFKALAGVAVPVRVLCNGAVFDEDMLFTHRGLSGPAILQISSFWRLGDTLHIRLLPEIDFREFILAQKHQKGRQALQTALAVHLPKRLAQDLVSHFGFAGNLADMNNGQIDSFCEMLTDWQVKPTGSEGYRTAEVTRGGVDTNALNAKTMEAKNTPGLFFIGEVVDVTGWLGGYNFQWAWACGQAAGQAL